MFYICFICLINSLYYFELVYSKYFTYDSFFLIKVQYGGETKSFENVMFLKPVLTTLDNSALWPYYDRLLIVT